MKKGERNEKTGWDWISEECEKVYPNQEPRCGVTKLPRRFGGPDKLDGVEMYDGGSYWHFVTYGLSELYEKIGSDITDYDRESVV